MSYTNDQWRSAITKLLKMTSNNKIRWETTTLESGDAWTTVDRSFKSSIEDKIYVVSQIRTKYYHDEDTFSWQGGFSFSIYERIGFDEYEKIATAPSMSAVASLFQAAESNMSFNRDALSGLLGD